MTRQFYSRPIIPLLISTISGIAFGCYLPGYSVASLAISCLSVGCVIFDVTLKKPTALSPIILLLALGYLSIQPWVSPQFPANHIHHFSDETRWYVVGVVDNHPAELNQVKKIVLQTETLTTQGNVFAVTGKIRVTVRGDSADLAKGDRIAFHSRLRTIRNFSNPGGFNYQRYMAFKGIWRTAYVRADRLHIVCKVAATSPSKFIRRARQAAITLIDRVSNQPTSGVLKALVVGDRTDVHPKVRNAFNRAGVGHLLAISGLHIGIVAMVAFFFFQKLLSYLKPLLWQAWTLKAAALLALFPVCFYGILSGMSPSTQRAVIMVSAFLITFLVERERDPMNTLALAALVILVAHPPSLFSISFQLSFSAAFSIIYGLTRFQNTGAVDGRTLKTGVYFFLKRKLYGFLLLSFFAICGTLPLVMFYFNQVSIIGLLANFLTVPLIGFIVTPLGLCALFLYPLSHFLALGCMQTCSVVLENALRIVIFLADVPFAAVKTITPSTLEIACYYVLGWALLNRVTGKPIFFKGSVDTSSPLPTVKAHGQDRGQSITRRGLRRLFQLGGKDGWNLMVLLRKKMAGLAVIVAILVSAGDVGYWLFNRFWDDRLRVTVIDVGQGNAALMELPGGYTILIDGGGFSDNSIFDMGARVIAPFLWHKKIKTIDTLVLTHPNSDHLNGLIFVSDNFNVKNVWTNNEPRNTSGYQALMKSITENHILLPEFKEMPRTMVINGVGIQILHPPRNFLQKKITEKWRSPNNNSLVLKISLGDISFLFPGDILAEAEKELVDLSGTRLASTALLSPHHGSMSSSTKAFLDKVEPEVVVISVGWKNRFRFPHAEVLAMYKQRGYRVYRTDTNGAITLTTDGKKLIIKPYTKEPGSM